MIHVVRGSFLTEPLYWLRLKFLVEITAWHVLQNEIDFFGIVEKPIQRQNVLVFEMRADFYFPFELFFNVALDKLFFVEHFQCNYKFAFLLPGKIDVTELTSAKRFADFKTINGPL